MKLCITYIKIFLLYTCWFGVSLYHLVISEIKPNDEKTLTVQWDNPLRESHSELVSCSEYGCSYPTQHWGEVSIYHFSSIPFPTWEKEILVHELAGSSQKIRQALLWRCSENMTCKVYWKTICPIMKEWPYCKLPFQWSLLFSSWLRWLRTSWTYPSPRYYYPFLSWPFSSLWSWTVKDILSNKPLLQCHMEIEVPEICFIVIAVVHRVGSLNCSEPYNIIFLWQTCLCIDDKINRAWKIWDVMRQQKSTRNEARKFIPGVLQTLCLCRCSWIWFKLRMIALEELGRPSVNSIDST